MNDLVGKQVRAKSMRIVVTKVVIAIPAFLGGGRGNGFMSSDTGILNKYKNHMLVETRRLSNMYVNVECMQLCHMPLALHVVKFAHHSPI